MVWCTQCAADVEVELDEANAFSCCVQCGRIVEDTAFCNDVGFSKGAGGEVELVGQLVGANGETRGLGRFAGGRMWAGGGDGHEAAVSRGRAETCALVEALHISPPAEAAEAAHRLYRLALQRGFTRGRKTNQVAAVCIYIYCRLEKRPYMIIDFSDHLSVNVHTLGKVFLQMLRLLRLDEHAVFTKPVDPSLFMNRFVDRLRLPTTELKIKVCNTALRLVQSMKRDWMLTGRRPNGICGAALFLAAHIHGVERTKKDIIGIVHVGYATVEKRVLELADTRDADLTLPELGERVEALEFQRDQALLRYETAAAASQDVAQNPDQQESRTAVDTVPPGDANASQPCCEHVRTGCLALAHGMCRLCLEEYYKLTAAGQEGTHDPPAYLRNVRREIRNRVQAQLAAAGQTVLKLQSSGVEVLALEAGNGELDVQRRRHLENEEAAAGNEGTADAGINAASASAPRTTQALVGEAVEDEFDEALNSANLKPLAHALGGVMPAVATALQQQRVRQPSSEPGLLNHAAPNIQRSFALADGSGGTLANEVIDDVGRASSAAPTADDTSGVNEGRAKRARTGGLTESYDAAMAGSRAKSGTRLTDDSPGRTGTEPTTAVLPIIPLAAAGNEGQGTIVQEEDLSSDHLSDVDDQDVEAYLATHEEANVREQLWVELNKDWIEKQEAKKAAGAADPSKPAERVKRKYVHKAKMNLPAADDAAEATSNALAAKRLSNKVNYSALVDLFGGANAPTGAFATPAKQQGSQQFAPSTGGELNGEGAMMPGSDGGEDGPREQTAVRTAKRGEVHTRPRAADSERYASLLSEEQKRYSGRGFLDALTFSRGNSQDSKRARPQGIGLKPRGR